jgi:hypothetical protein
MVPFPCAFKFTELPMQMEASLEAVTLVDTTFNGTCIVSDPQLSLTITVKMVFVKTVAVGFDRVASSNTFAGDHE